VLNKIQHFIYTAHAETLQDKPSADVLPATDDYMAALDQDVNKAYLNYVMEPVNANWDLQLSIAVLWALITPSGWIKWVWDPVMQRPDMFPVPFFDLAVDQAPARGRWHAAVHAARLASASGLALLHLTGHRAASGADGLEQVRGPGHHDSGELCCSEVVDSGRAADAEPAQQRAAADPTWQFGQHWAQAGADSAARDAG
jgi:hypothetical protein